MSNGRWCESGGAESARLVRYIFVVGGEKSTLLALQRLVHRQFPPAPVAGLYQTLCLQAESYTEVGPKLLCSQSCTIQEVR